MCKYCELKDKETIILDEEKYIKLIIQKIEIIIIY